MSDIHNGKHMTNFERLINNAIDCRKFPLDNGRSSPLRERQSNYLDICVVAEIGLGESERLDMDVFAAALMKSNKKMGALGALEVLAKAGRTLRHEVVAHPGIETKSWYLSLRTFGEAVERMECKSIDQETIRRLQEE